MPASEGGQRGRPKTPVSINKLRGNPGKRKERSEPEYADSEQWNPPDDLDPIAADEWRRVFPLLLTAGVMKDVDIAAFRMYCEHYAVWVKAADAVKRTGLIITTTNGNFVQNPALGVMNKAAIIVKNFMSAFGITPSSRAGLKSGDLDEDDEFTKYLEGVSNR